MTKKIFGYIPRVTVTTQNDAEENGITTQGRSGIESTILENSGETATKQTQTDNIRGAKKAKKLENKEVLGKIEKNFPKARVPRSPKLAKIGKVQN